MAWVILVRTLFMLAVTARVRDPSVPHAPDRQSSRRRGTWRHHVARSRLRSAEVTDLLGALIGSAIGLGLAKTIGAALFWADTTDPRVMFLHSFILLVFP